MRTLPLSITSICLALVGCGKAPEQPQMPPPAVEVITLKEDALIRSSDYVSRTLAINDVIVMSQVTSTLKDQHFTTGQDVVEGDLLFTLDDAQYKNKVTQAKAAVARAESDLKQAKRNYSRGSKLRKQGNISQADMDTLSNSRDSASAGLIEAKAALEQAELELSYTQIKAPIAGRMGVSLHSTGDVINANSEKLTNIAQMDPMRTAFQISEKKMASRSTAGTDSSIEAVNRDFVFELILPNGELYEHRGTLVYADNRVNEATGTIRLSADFPNPDGALLSGQYVTVVIKKAEPDNVIMVPQSAVQQMQGGYSVLIVDGENIAQTVNVELGDRYEANWEVTKGLKEGDKVIVNGIQKVQVGMPVTPSEQQHAPFDSNAQQPQDAK